MNQVPIATPTLAFTGERFVPGLRGAIWHEHWHRYALVQEIVRGRRVLDAACGEGYGAFHLARTAKSVVAVDIAQDAIAHARVRYPCHNVTFVSGSVARLPLPDASVDVITSFETIEHLAEQGEMLREFRRVLTPLGVLVLSSPNKPVYSANASDRNEFHVRELDRAELEMLLDPIFPQQDWYGQSVLAHSLLWSLSRTPRVATHLRLDGDAAILADDPAEPMYFLVIAGAMEIALPALTPLSLFGDAEHTLDHDLQRAPALRLDLADAQKIADERLQELITAVNSLSSEQQRSGALSTHVASLEAELATALQQIGVERASNAGLRAHISFRESPAGWLRWPMHRLKARLTGAR